MGRQRLLTLMQSVRQRVKAEPSAPFVPTPTEAAAQARDAEWERIMRENTDTPSAPPEPSPAVEHEWHLEAWPDVPVPQPLDGEVPDVNIVTVIIVNFRTAHLTSRAVETVLSFYPNIAMTLVDNGSQDVSTDLVKSLAEAHPTIMPVLNTENVGHGPALHTATLHALTPYVFTFDSDCEMVAGGMIEAMLQRFALDDTLFATGWLRWTNDCGVAIAERKLSEFTPQELTAYYRYIHPSAMMFDKAKYMHLPPFELSGAPCIKTMMEVPWAGWHVEAFPVEQYATHLVAGTRRLYGGRWDPSEGEQPQPWNPNARIPI